MIGKDKLLNKIAFRAELPSEMISGMPLVEMIGCQRVLIENHKGITMYGCREICVKVSYGLLSIYGSDLELARMTRQQLVIAGRIEGISLHRGARQ